MTEPITAITAIAIIDLAFKKFIESASGELAKKFTESAIAKMDQLRQTVWAKLLGRSPKLDEALARV